jgi:hypothetical protein
MIVERCPNQLEVGGSIPGCAIVPLLAGKLVMWSSASCVSRKKERKNIYTQ